jgi:hypothetical protein
VDAEGKTTIGHPIGAIGSIGCGTSRSPAVLVGDSHYGFVHYKGCKVARPALRLDAHDKIRRCACGRTVPWCPVASGRVGYFDGNLTISECRVPKWLSSVEIKERKDRAVTTRCTLPAPPTRRRDQRTRLCSNFMILFDVSRWDLLVLKRHAFEVAALELLAGFFCCLPFEAGETRPVERLVTSLHAFGKRVGRSKRGASRKLRFT